MGLTENSRHSPDHRYGPQSSPCPAPFPYRQLTMKNVFTLLGFHCELPVGSCIVRCAARRRIAHRCPRTTLCAAGLQDPCEKKTHVFFHMDYRILQHDIIIFSQSWYAGERVRRGTWYNFFFAHAGWREHDIIFFSRFRCIHGPGKNMI